MTSFTFWFRSHFLNIQSLLRHCCFYWISFYGNWNSSGCTCWSSWWKWIIWALICMSMSIFYCLTELLQLQRKTCIVGIIFFSSTYLHLPFVLSFLTIIWCPVLRRVWSTWPGTPQPTSPTLALLVVGWGIP